MGKKPKTKLKIKVKGKKVKKPKTKLKIKVKAKKHVPVAQIDYNVTVKSDDACQASVAPFFQGLMSKDFKFRTKPFVFINAMMKALGTRKANKKWKKFFVAKMFASRSGKSKAKLKLKLKGKKSKNPKTKLKLKVKGKKSKKPKTKLK